MLASFFLLTQDVEMSCPPWTGGQKGKDSLYSRDEGPQGFTGQLQPASCHLKLHGSVFMYGYTCMWVHTCGCSA